MAYIVNISETTAITVNLSQGRVQLEPNGYCELHPLDLERAKKCYNSKEVGLCVVETDHELELLTSKKEQPARKPKTDEVAPATAQTNSQINDQSAVVPPAPVTATENSSDDSSDVDPKEKAKKEIEERIELYRSQGNLNDLKELATKLGISYMYNISFDKLAEKILMHIN